MLNVRFGQPLAIISGYFSILNLIETLIRISIFGQSEAGLLFQAMAITAITYGILESKNFETLLITSSKNILSQKLKDRILRREKLTIVLSILIGTGINLFFYSDKFLIIFLGALSAAYFSLTTNYKLSIANTKFFTKTSLLVILSRTLFILVQLSFLYLLNWDTKQILIASIFISLIIIWIITNCATNEVNSLEINTRNFAENFPISKLTLSNWVISTLSSIYKQIDIIFVGQISNLATVSIFKIFQQALAPLTIFIEMVLQKKTHLTESVTFDKSGSSKKIMLLNFSIVTFVICLLLFFINIYYSINQKDFLLLIPMYFQIIIAYFSGSKRLILISRKNFKAVNLANFTSVSAYLFLGIIFIHLQYSLLILLILKFILSGVNLIMLNFFRKS